MLSFSQSNNLKENSSSISLDLPNSIISNDYEIQSSEPQNISKYEYIDKKKLILCQNCGKSPKISFNSLKLININCECQIYENENIEKFYEYFFTFTNNKIKFENFTCQNHLNKKFRYFCEDCNFDICKDCIAKDGKHKTHTYVSLLDCKKQFEVIKEFKENEYFSEIMDLLKMAYEEYPNSNLYETINNAFSFISQKKYNNNDLNNDILIEAKRMLKIRISSQILENKNNINEIIEIQIIRQNFHNLNELCQFEFPNLKLLNLSENNIDDISPLKNLISPNLEGLVLLKNKINDKNIKYIKDFQFQKLKTLNFFNNNFTNYQIFDEIKVFKNLTLLYIGSNRFQEDISHININTIKYNFYNLKTLGVTKGVFTNNTIELLTYFKFPKLTTLYLSGNNLNSLSFVKNIDCPELKEIWLKDNDLKDFEELLKFKKLEIFNLENNLIKSLEKIEPFLKMGKLKKVYISENKIELKKNKKLIGRIKKQIDLILNYS